MLTQKRLKELLIYDPSTGEFTAINNTRGALTSGSRTGWITRYGYIGIGIDYKQYLAHRLAWLYVHGKWPGLIDHINGERTDNRISNLRDVTHAGNHQNMKGPQKNNSHGFMGASRNKNRWASQINVNGKRIYLGTFDTPEKAHAEYIKAKRKLHPTNTL